MSVNIVSDLLLSADDAAGVVTAMDDHNKCETLSKSALELGFLCRNYSLFMLRKHCLM